FGWLDVLLRRCAYRKFVRVAFAHHSDRVAGTWCRNVAIGAECEVSRHSLRLAIFDSALDVCLTDYLSGQPDAAEMAMVAVVQSAQRDHRGLSSGVAGPDAFSLVSPRPLSASYFRSACL